jgi:Domain of unknown function (DUF5668)
MNNRNIFWGVLLVIVGFLFLADNLNWVNFDITLRAIARFWPLLFILAGVSALVSQRRTAITPIMIAIAIPLALFHFVDDKVHRFGDNIGNNWNFDDDDDDDNKSNDNENNTYSNSDAIKQDYTVDNADDVKEATLNLKGGAAKFDLGQADTKLFVANTELEYGNYSLTEDKKDGVKVIDFEMKGKKNGNDKDFNFHFGNGSDNNNRNKVHLKLNPKVAWNFDMGIGAGDLEFDLSEFVVKSLNLETGAAAIDLKLGDKADKTDVTVKSGVASVEIQVPTGVGCQIKSEGALSSTDFEGFSKVNGVYQTPDFDKATKKIIIKAESGLSSLKVSRY